MKFWEELALKMYLKEEMKIQEKIKEALDKARPSLQADGGDVELIGVDDKGVVKVRLTGACGGLPYGDNDSKEWNRKNS